MKKSFLLVLFISFCYTLKGQSTAETYTLNDLKTRFKFKNYSDKTLLDFQATWINLRQKPELNEDIPGEIISWYTLSGRFSMHKSYLVKEDKIHEISTLPTDELFLKTINSYVPQALRFSYSSDLWSFAFVHKKLEGGFYLIQATAKSFNSQPEIPNDAILSYDFEYKTNDFKKFQLVRLKDIHSKEWIEVGEK